MTDTKYQKVDELPKGSLRVSLFAKEHGIKNPDYVYVKYDRHLKLGWVHPGYKIVSFQGINFAVAEKPPVIEGKSEPAKTADKPALRPKSSQKAVPVKKAAEPQKNTELDRLKAELKAIPDTKKGLGKALAKKLQKEIDAISQQ